MVTLAQVVQQHALPAAPPVLGRHSAPLTAVCRRHDGNYSAVPPQVLQLLAMLLPSWQLLRSHPTSRDVVIDLLVFCDGGSCKELPPECRPMRDAGENAVSADQAQP